MVGKWWFRRGGGMVIRSNSPGIVLEVVMVLQIKVMLEEVMELMIMILAGGGGGAGAVGNDWFTF
jgi:hypothetical protein